MSHLTLSEARNRLAWIWFPVCGILILVLIFQSIFGAYGTRQTEAWGWAMPNFFPTLALMMSVFGANALGGIDTEATTVKRSFFYISLGLSIFYLFVLVVILIAPVFGHFVFDQAATPQVRLDTMLDSNVYLGPIQSLVVGALGVLFFLKEKASPANQPDGSKTPGQNTG